MLFLFYFIFVILSSGGPQKFSEKFGNLRYPSEVLGSVYA